MSDSARPPVPLHHARETAISVLCEHFALDHLDSSELEQRIDLAHQATSLQALDALTADLPARKPGDAAVAGDAEIARVRADHQAVIAVMGGAERRGHWTPAARVIVVTLMGGADLDFRDAQLPPGVTEVFIVALMGGAEIIVPPGLRVESNGVAIMGGWGHSEHARAPTDPNSPILRIGGVAVMGGVDITERLPGESPRDARGRRRDESRQRKLERQNKRLSGD